MEGVFCRNRKWGLKLAVDMIDIKEYQYIAADSLHSW